MKIFIQHTVFKIKREGKNKQAHVVHEIQNARIVATCSLSIPQLRKAATFFYLHVFKITKCVCFVLMYNKLLATSKLYPGGHKLVFLI